MTPTPPFARLQAIHQLLQEGQSPLAVLHYKLQQVQHLTNYIQTYLPSPLNQHVYATALTAGSLIIACSSAEWAMLLRYHCPELLSYLREQTGLSHLANIHCRVAASLPVVNLNPAPQLLKQPAPLSAITRQLLEEAATHIRNPKLQQALQRLALVKTTKLC